MFVDVSISARRTLLAGSIVLALLAACGPAKGGDGDDDVTVDTGIAQPDFDGGPDVDGGGPPAALAVLSLDPDHGPYAGGTMTQIKGRGFIADAKVYFGGRQVDPQDVKLLDSRRMNVITPPGDVGPVDVIIVASNGTALLHNGFTYDAFYLDPPSGALAGGTFVRIVGRMTQWTATDAVSIGGRPLVDRTFVSAFEIDGKTPPGLAPGAVDVTVTTASVPATAEKAFTYYRDSDPIFGGLGGAHLTGNLNVTVVDAISGNLVDNASVFVGNPLTTAHRGLTNAMGQVVFAGSDLVGKQSVTAAKSKYETQSVLSFDAQDLTIFLVPIPPPPQPGTLPPGRFAAIIDGSISFGGATGVGTTTWDLVPDPRTPTEHKVAHVFTTTTDIFNSNPAPGAGGNITYVPNMFPAPRSWPYRIVARPGALAVIAVVGLEDSDTKAFTPFAMGVHRNVVTGPGENARGIDISVDLPLDVALSVDLQNPPAMRSLGPDGYEVDAYVDLGGEGVIVMPGSASLLLPGSHLAVIGNQPPILRALSDSSYTIVAKAETGLLGATMTGVGGPPESVRVLNGITDVSRPIVVDGWHGVPHAIEPLDGGTARGRQLVWAPDGGDAIGTFNFMLLETLGNPSEPVWRFVTRGDVFAADLPDLRTINATLPDVPPPPEDLFWVVYSVTIPGVTFDQFTYNQLNEKYWSAHALNFFVIEIPASP